jgi:MtN3 and saliva related transmembrane protein
MTPLGIVAASWGVAMAVSPVLQMRTMIQRRSSAGLSRGYLVVLIIGFALWIAYGASKHDVPILVPNAVALLVMACTLGVARRYR